VDNLIYISSGAAPAEIAFLQSASSTANATTYTFSSQNLGTADAGRYIAVGVGGRGFASISSVTVGGVSATIVSQLENGSSSNVAGIAIAAVPTGTTGDIVVTWNEAGLRMGISVYRITNLTSPTISDVSTSTANDPSVTLDIPVNGIGMGMALAQTSSGTASWTGMTEDADFNVESQISLSSGSIELEAGETGRAVSINWSAGSSCAATFVSWE
jgi:hypothetical protein